MRLKTVRPVAWTDDQIERLKALHAEKLSTRVIAERLGRSRNAIIGKLCRLGPYEMHVTWSENKADCSNRIKALEDYLERIHMIENDRFCRRLTAEFGTVSGCRVKLRAWVAA